jgi:perosamine synthetase
MDIIPFACLNIDCNWSQWLSALTGCFTVSKEPHYYTMKIEDMFSDSEQAIVTLCVRTVFDLYLQVKKFPKGSEVIMTAINIPDMSTVLL